MNDTNYIYTEAFAVYGAKLTNPLWSVSAFGDDGNLVVSLWQNHIKPGPRKGTLQYTDTLSSWLGNEDGCNELKKHLRLVESNNLKFRLVIAKPKTDADAARVGKVADERSIKKNYFVRTDFLGTLDEFDGDTFRIVFGRAA
jgi:hypothetical protein